MIKGNILLVDDDLDDQLIFKDALGEIAFAYQCVLASNGLEGLKKLESETGLPAIIFLDLNMPLMNGLEFLLRIRQSELYKNIPVIIYSTSDNPADKKRMLRSGATRFITKTANFRKLKETLSEILGQQSKI
jgi:CheY-like chemotaxis protein